MIMSYFFFFFKQKTAYEVRISDWISDVCSSDLTDQIRNRPLVATFERRQEIMAGGKERIVSVSRQGEGRFSPSLNRRQSSVIATPQAHYINRSKAEAGTSLICASYLGSDTML